MPGIQWISPSTLQELTLLGIAFVLSMVVGLERHRQVKSAGLRTHTLVGVGSAIFTLVSAYGFAGLSAPEAMDPSRIAAQIVSGVGFLGAGVIFVRQNIVSGLTTAASVWVVASIGMACGAGMPVVAACGTVLHLVTVSLLSRLARRIPTAGQGRELVIVYKDGRGALRQILERATELGFEVSLSGTRRDDSAHAVPRVMARMRFLRGRVPVSELIDQLTTIRGVRRIDMASDADSSL